MFVDYLNQNIQIIIDCWEETFFERLELPGIPPITLIMPGVTLPGVDPFEGSQRARAELVSGAMTGNRYPWQLGGEASAPWQFGGFPGLDLPSTQITIPGRDPMTVVMEFWRTNYQILQEEFASRDIVMVQDWSQSFNSCDPPPNLNPPIQGIIDQIPPADSIDGPSLGGSSIPTFGPGSGGPGSCWTILAGEVIDLGDGTFGVRSDTGLVEVEGKCTGGCTSELDGTVDWGATLHSTGDAGVVPGSACASMNLLECPAATPVAGGSCAISKDETAIVGGQFAPLASPGSYTLFIGMSTTAGNITTISAPFVRETEGGSTTTCVICTGSDGLRKF